ncbi:UNVERIFIED_CONTAM: protein ESKIMO 1 [Sesamum radiatum]|uniref:Protein ESKIMO 1 n=1 Tax=Sesamum radiatum TaxID=300843 RepID=A0AAW2K6S2_SESRA
MECQRSQKEYGYDQFRADCFQRRRFRAAGLVYKEQKNNVDSILGDEEEEIEIPPQECDLFQENGYLIREEECEYLTSQATCMRMANETLGIRTKMFKARILMEKLRNKRVMFLGDESMICLV